MKTVLTNCTVIDCTGQEPMQDTTVVIEGEKIAELKPGIVYQPVEGEGQVRVFDLQGGYVLPGLWSCHAHLGSIFPDPKNLRATESVADNCIRCGRNAIDALRVGITGIRSVADRDYVDIAWKRAFNAGVMVGPRLFCSGMGVIITGGHGWTSPGTVEVDGPYEVRKAVREQLKRGADQIKLMITGGVATSGESMTECQFLLDEIRAATEVAHEKGKRVGVHCGSYGGAKRAIQGGVDVIHHGYYLDDEVIEMMAEHGTWYVPTMFVTQYEEFMIKSGMKPFQLEKARGAAKAHREGFQKALKAGVKMCAGADSSPIAEFTLVDIEQLVKCGMTEMQALMAATRNAAELNDVVDQLGTVEVGKLADLIVLSADPLDNISNIRELKMVMKGGHVVDTSPQEGLADFWELFFT